jgi:SAM-dependent methyltransferase
MTDSSPSLLWTNTNAYEAIMGRWSSPSARVVLEWLALPPGLAWLDFGCGTGALTRAILETANPREVLGVDPSAEFLGLAAEQISYQGVRFAIGNAHALPADDDSFDVTISGLVMSFVPDPRTAIVEMARVVRRGGTVASYIWDVEDEQQFTRPFWKAAMEVDPAVSALDPRTQFTLGGIDALSELWMTAGLEDVSAADIAMPTVFRDFGDYWQPCLLDGSTPIQKYARSLSADQQTALREQLRAVLPIAADGSISLLGHLAVVRGTK